MIIIIDKLGYDVYSVKNMNNICSIENIEAIEHFVSKGIYPNSDGLQRVVIRNCTKLMILDDLVFEKIMNFVS